ERAGAASGTQRLGWGGLLVVRVLLAGGGTAGHTSAVLATAGALRESDADVEITCLGTPRGLETRLVPEAGYALELVPPVPFPRGLSPDLIRVPGRLRAASRAARDIVDRVRPDVICGFGGYVAVSGDFVDGKLRL